jgi:hypothetical protein
MDLFSQHSDKAELLLLSWAYKHPYLYTFIETFNPTLFVLITAATVLNMVINIYRKKQWQRGR